jgi:Ca-activated chloride channel family protein
MADDEPRPQLTWGVEEVSMGALAIDPAATLLAREPPPASRIRLAEVTQTDGLPVPVVQRIVRQSFGRFRVAYERGLTKNPKLAGRVVVRFTIGRDGSVLESSDGGSSLPDADVVRDVVHALMALSFPAPDNDGSVVVTMPIDFARSS